MTLYLKPCPFCGHSNIQTEDCRAPDQGWYAVCMGCHAQGPLRSTPERANLAWDDRAMVE